LQIHRALVRLLLNLRGVERVQRFSVGAGLDEARLAGRIAGVVQRPDGRRRGALALRSESTTTPTISATSARIASSR